MHISGSVTLRVPSFGDNCQWPCPPYWGCRFSLGWGWGWGFNAWYTAGGVTKRRVAAALPFLYPSPKDPGWRLPSFVAAPPAGGAPPASLPAGSRRGVRVQSRPPADARASWRQAASRPQLGLRGRTRCPRPPPLSARGGAGRARGAPAPLSAVTWGRAQQVSGLAPSAGNAESTPETAALRVALGGGGWVEPRNSGGDRQDLARGGRSCEETGSLRPTFCKRLGVESLGICQLGISAAAERITGKREPAV
ncbi:uncharacterized protein GPR160 isoform X1 [Felis catus]|nr:uncharacterized protein GPR160 isoform X1 [Felis catus]